MVPDASGWSESVRWRPVGVLAGLVAVLVLGERAVTTVIEGVVDGGGEFPVWFPHARSIGETAVLYSMAFDVLQFVVIPAVLLWVGYVHGRHQTADADGRR